jgi:hypothetical protein
MPYETPATLEDALLQPEMRAAFRAHVEAEFSTENLDFHEAVEGYRKLGDDPTTTPGQLKQGSDEIYNKFIKIRDVKPGVQMSLEEQAENQQINLSGEQHKSVQDVRNNPHATLEQQKKMFDVADHGIMQLTNKDTFQRFKTSERCKAAVKEIQGGLDQDYQSMVQLRERQGQLIAPSLGDRMKGAVTTGGLEKMRADNLKEIEELQKKMDARSLKAPKNEVDLSDIAPAPQVAQDRGVVPVVAKQEAPKEQRGPKVQAPPRPGPELEVEGIGMENVGGVKVGEGRGRSNAVDQGRPRSQSVREALGGKVGAPKQGGDLGPKVSKGGVK